MPRRSGARQVRRPLRLAAQVLEESKAALESGAIDAADYWTLTSWIESLDLGHVVANALLRHLHSHSTDTRLEREFMSRIGRFGSLPTILALLRDALLLEELSNTIWLGAKNLDKDMQLRAAELAKLGPGGASKTPEEGAVSAADKGGSEVVVENVEVDVPLSVEDLQMKLEEV